MRFNMNKKNHGLSTVFKKSKILLLFGLIASLSACESSIINNKVDEKDTENTQERPDYDDMTELVRYAPFSKNNNNFLVLNPSAYPKASAFKIEVKASEEMKDGTYEFVTIWENKITLDKPYLSIPKEFNTRNETKYAIMITALDGEGQQWRKVQSPHQQAYNRLWNHHHQHIFIAWLPATVLIMP